MPLFMVTKTSSALSTTGDSLTITASATKPLRILMAKVAGNGSASVANEVVLQRSTGTATGGASLPPAKVNYGSAAASFTVLRDSTGGSSLTANEILHRFSMNANGGIDPFVALPGGELSIPVGGQVSLRSIAGTSLAIMNVMIEEVDG
jgi:hypothetical protein